MTTLLTIYLAGMPCAAGFLFWSFSGLPGDDWDELATIEGLAAFAVWVVCWPFFLVLTLIDVWGDDE